MASELELRWLKANDFKGAAKRFATFCKEDIKSQVGSEKFNPDVYQDAVKLVLSKLDRSLSLIELTNRIAAEEESQQPDLDSSPDDETESDADDTNIEDEALPDVEDIITEGKHDAD